MRLLIGILGSIAIIVFAVSVKLILDKIDKLGQIQFDSSEEDEEAIFPDLIEDYETNLLFLTVVPNWKDDCMTAVDFSRYEDKGIIGFTLYSEDDLPQGQLKKYTIKMDDGSVTTIIPNGIVRKIVFGGEAIWIWGSSES